jgi:hypothetical protein
MAARPGRTRLYTRSLGEELDYLRRHLKKDETQILAMALRRGVFETFKSVVMKQYAAGEISDKKAAELLGGKVFQRMTEWLPAGPPGPA